MEKFLTTILSFLLIIDNISRQSSTIKSGEYGGLYSRLYSLLMSIGGDPASEAVECWRCGVDTGER